MKSNHCGECGDNKQAREMGSHPSGTSQPMQTSVYLDTDGFWTWTASENDRIIMISTGHRSKTAAQRHAKRHRPCLD
jgi:hypothetical protein